MPNLTPDVLTMAITTHPPVPSVTSLSRGDIWIEPEVQQRTCLDAATVQEYTALYQEGRDLGPLVVFRENDVYLLADGFHRYEAACFANVTTLPVVIYHGTLRDALFYATSCNLHGKPLTNADKWRRVLTVLQDSEWAQWSDNAIAKHCGVTQPFVGTVRKSLRTVISETAQAVPTARTYQDKHGHVHTMETSKIGQRALAPEAQGRAPEVLDRDEADVPASLTEALVLEAEAPAEDGTPVEIHRNRWGSVTEPSPPSQVARREYTGDAEWYTPAEVVALVRQVLGTIDVDPASCAQAQETVQARTYYTLEEDGLRQRWPGTVFCNPPYHMPELARFCGKLLEELDAQQTTAAILLTNSVTDTEWFHRIAPRANAICFTDGRLQFVHATRDGLRPCQGQAVFYFGPHPERFCEVFAGLGVLMQVVGAKAAGPQLPLAETPPAPVPVSQPKPAPVPQTERPGRRSYDPAKFVLGKLCAGGHEFRKTGKTLRRINGRGCQQCDTEKKRHQYAPRKERDEH